MKIANRLGRARRGFVCVVAGLALVGCVSVDRNVVASSGGDFTVLTCGQIDAAAFAIAQRRERMQSAEAEAGVGEQARLLDTASRDLERARLEQGCESTRAAAAEPKRPAAEPTVLAQVQPEPAPASAKRGTGSRYLQVGLFSDEINRERVVRHFAERGLAPTVVPTTIAGARYSRVLVGPLRDQTHIDEIDRVAMSIGIRDAFFVTR